MTTNTTSDRITWASQLMSLLHDYHLGTAAQSNLAVAQLRRMAEAADRSTHWTEPNPLEARVALLEEKLERVQNDVLRAEGDITDIQEAQLFRMTVGGDPVPVRTVLTNLLRSVNAIDQEVDDMRLDEDELRTTITEEIRKVLRGLFDN